MMMMYMSKGIGLIEPVFQFKSTIERVMRLMESNVKMQMVMLKKLVKYIWLSELAFWLLVIVQQWTY